VPRTTFTNLRLSSMPSRPSTFNIMARPVSPPASPSTLTGNRFPRLKAVKLSKFKGSQLTLTRPNLFPQRRASKNRSKHRLPRRSSLQSATLAERSLKLSKDWRCTSRQLDISRDATVNTVTSGSQVTKVLSRIRKTLVISSKRKLLRTLGRRLRALLPSPDLRLNLRTSRKHSKTTLRSPQKDPNLPKSAKAPPKMSTCRNLL